MVGCATKRIIATGMLGSSLMLLGCNNSESAKPHTPVIPPLPPLEQLQLIINDSPLDTLDFLWLEGCEVQTPVRRRNSRLGRSAAPSQRLLLDLEYLRLAPQCIALKQENRESELATALQQAWELQRAQLPSTIYNATLASIEYRDFWRSRPLDTRHTKYADNMALTALETITIKAGRWLHEDFHADNLGFELLLGDVSTGDASQLWLAGRASCGFLQSILDLERLLDAELPPAYQQWRSLRNRNISPCPGSGNLVILPPQD